MALLVALCLGAAVVLRAQAGVGLRRVDRELDDLSGTLTSVLGDELGETPDVAGAAREACETVKAPGRAVAILDASGHPLAAHWDGLDPPAALAGSNGSRRVWTAVSPGGDWRVHAVPQSFRTRSFVLLVAAPLSDVTREQHEVQEAMVIGIPIALLIASAGGLLPGKSRLGRCVRSPRRSARRRQFMADASHELRTPVSIVRVSADVALSREHRDEAEYREALGIVAGQAQRLGRLVDDMLVLARADAGGYALRLSDLYFDEVVADCGRAAGVLATERGVTIRLGGASDVP